MSIKLMMAAWDVPPAIMPTGRKFVLVALCDQSNDEGECYPSIRHLARKCSMSERAMQVHLSALESTEALTRTFRDGRSTLYKLNPSKFTAVLLAQPPQNLHPAESAPTPAESAPTPAESAPTPAESAPTPAESAPTPAESAPITITKPLPNHHLPTDPAPASVPTEKSAVVVGGDFEKVEGEKELPWAASLNSAERNRGAVILCGLSPDDAAACVQLLTVALTAGGISSPMGYLAGLAKRARAGSLDYSPLPATAPAVAQRDSVVTPTVENSNRDAEMAWLRTMAAAAGMTLVQTAEVMARHLLPYLPKNEQNMNQSV